MGFLKPTKKKYKIRVISKNNYNQSLYGISIPEFFYKKFGDSCFFPEVSGNCIVFYKNEDKLKNERKDCLVV